MCTRYVVQMFSTSELPTPEVMSTSNAPASTSSTSAGSSTRRSALSSFIGAVGTSSSSSSSVPRSVPPSQLSTTLLSLRQLRLPSCFEHTTPLESARLTCAAIANCAWVDKQAVIPGLVGDIRLQSPQFNADVSTLLNSIPALVATSRDRLQNELSMVCPGDLFTLSHLCWMESKTLNYASICIARGAAADVYVMPCGPFSDWGRDIADVVARKKYGVSEAVHRDTNSNEAAAATRAASDADRTSLVPPLLKSTALACSAFKKVIFSEQTGQNHFITVEIALSHHLVTITESAALFRRVSSPSFCGELSSIACDRSNALSTSVEESADRKNEYAEFRTLNWKRPAILAAVWQFVNIAWGPSDEWQVMLQVGPPQKERVLINCAAYAIANLMCAASSVSPVVLRPHTPTSVGDFDSGNDVAALRFALTSLLCPVLLAQADIRAIAREDTPVSHTLSPSLSVNDMFPALNVPPKIVKSPGFIRVGTQSNILRGAAGSRTKPDDEPVCSLRSLGTLGFYPNALEASDGNVFCVPRHT